MSEKQPPKETFDVSALYRLHAVEQPPESLDQRILEQAKQHTQAANIDELDKQRSKRLGRSWQWPVSAAAVVVIASTLTIDLYQKDGMTVETFPEVQMHSPLPPASMMKPAQSMSDLRDFEAEHDLISEPEMAMDDLSEPAIIQNKQVLERETLRKEELRLERSKRERSALSSPQPMAAEMRTEMKAPKLERHRSPVEWLTEIERLLEEGRDSEAREALTKFREAHPLVEIPESIQALLPKVNAYEK
ncbi:hypothetical protein [Litoribacillus peritrichatus]|uniref:Anti-sigma factor n=1 Tax=Litoribacillus peritrichatus TaxID=718191 RepID=A0ABP7M1N6_9GAMM